jgi:hypothetical protein
MAVITITGTDVCVHMQGNHQLFTLQSTITIPISSIIDAECTNIHKEFYDYDSFITRSKNKLIGTNVYRKHICGVFITLGNKTFWDVSHPDKTVRILLHDHAFTSITIDVDKPEFDTNRIRSAMQTKNHTVLS